MKAGGRWRHWVIAATACAAVAGMAGCSPGRKPDPGPAAVLPAGASRALGGGALYLLLGNQPISANLWQVVLPGGRTRQLTFNPALDGVSNFNASPAGLVLGDARTTVDLAEVMHGGKPRLLSGGIGDSPQINAAGQVVDVEDGDTGTRHGPYSHDRLLLWDASADSHFRTIYRVPPGDLASNAWNPAGTLILLTDPPGDLSRTPLVTVNTHGRVVHRLGVLLGAPNVYAWGRYGLAIGYFGPGPDEVLSLAGRVKARLPAGWVPGCWNPAGTALLVISRDQRRIGLWRPADPARVQDLGSMRGPAVQECSWTSRPAAGVSRG
jgi:hypothetical protein